MVRKPTLSVLWVGLRNETVEPSVGCKTPESNRAQLFPSPSRDATASSWPLSHDSEYSTVLYCTVQYWKNQRPFSTNFTRVTYSLEFECNVLRAVLASGLRHELDIILQLSVNLVLPGLLRRGLDKVNHESRLVGKHGVCAHVRALAVKDLCHELLVTGCLDEQVNVCRPHGAPVEQPEDVSCAAVVGNRVGGGYEASEAVRALVVGGKLAAVVVVWLVGVLLLVEAVGARVPHVDLGAHDGPARRGACQRAVEQAGDAGFSVLGLDAVVENNVCAVRILWGVEAVEWGRGWQRESPFRRARPFHAQSCRRATRGPARPR